MKFSGNPDYAYAVGVIRVREKELLNRERFYRLAETKSMEDLLRLLSDTPYGEGGHDEGRPENILQEGLKREFLQTISLFSTLCRDDSVKEAVFLRYDFHNAKVVFKEKATGETYGEARYPEGNYSFDVLKAAIEENLWWDIEPALRDVLRGCRDEIERDPRPLHIDHVLDRAMFQAMLERVGGAVPFIRQWVVSEVDLTNIGAFFRCRYAERSKSCLQDALIAGGGLDGVFFEKIWDEPSESLPAKFQHTAYRRIVEKGVEGFAQDSFADLDRAMMEYRLAFHRETRNVAMGIEPLISFLFFKETETKVLRMILVGKQNRIEPEILKEYIPHGIG